ncbi:MAG: hypothetical protein ACR2NB_05775 [Solirubrobacteraceae bacterium]
MTSPSMRPTAKQLKYLRVLADRTHTSFAMPSNVNEASLEISRLKKALGSAPAEKRAWETLSAKRDREHIARDMQEAPRDATRFREDETRGWGSDAGYADPWDGHHTKED